MKSALMVTAALVAGCAGSSLSAADKAARCATFAKTVSAAHLATTPDEATARDTANALDSLLPKMSTPALHEPAIQVHQQLHEVEKWRRKADAGRADAAAQKARDRLAELAKACDLPTSDFLGPAEV